MKTTKIKLDVPYEKCGVNSNGCEAFLTSYIPDFCPDDFNGSKRPAVVICPGGGYDYCSEREAEPVALRFASFGFAAFVLEYSCVKKLFPTNLLELAVAVKNVRLNAKEFFIDSEKIFVCGFSAGGHLAGSLAVHWKKEFLTAALTDYAHKPNGAVLCYPVIKGDDFIHEGSIQNITDGDENLVKLVSLDKQVSSDTPPVFIWHTADDGTVPVINAIDFTSALAKNNISFESHIYTSGVHGLALCDRSTARYDGHINKQCAEWFSLAANWMFGI